jgi:hypothetical protein
MTATLRLTRRWGGVTDGGKWQVIIDGEVAGSIDKKDTVEIPVEPGRHTLRVERSKRFLSRERAFQADDGEVAGFSCRSQMMWPMYFAALVKPDLWISLKEY